LEFGRDNGGASPVVVGSVTPVCGVGFAVRHLLVSAAWRYSRFDAVKLGDQIEDEAESLSSRVSGILPDRVALSLFSPLSLGEGPSTHTPP
jgi:hypothetical protein